METTRRPNGLRRPLHSLLVAAILSAATGALAQSGYAWSLIGSHSGDRLYIDRDHAVTDGEVVHVWMLYDYAGPQGDPPDEPYLSVAMHEEIHCVEGTIRSVAVRLFAENLGRGRVLLSQALENPALVRPPAGSGREQEVNASCGRDAMRPFVPPRPPKESATGLG
jgi:hypothetical protein